MSNKEAKKNARDILLLDTFEDTYVSDEELFLTYDKIVLQHKNTLENLND